MVDGRMPEIAIVIMSGNKLPRRQDLPLKATFVATFRIASARHHHQSPEGYGC